MFLIVLFNISRHRPTKSKLECKLEFFGFEDGPCEDGDAEPGTSYKIKYFGFDELSESDSEDEDDRPGKKKKKKDAAEIGMMTSDSPEISDAQNLTHTGTVCSQASSVNRQGFIYTLFTFLSHFTHHVRSFPTVCLCLKICPPFFHFFPFLIACSDCAWVARLH